MARIYNLQDIPEDLLPQVGGKAKGLYKLQQFGFNVPEAFIITDIDETEDFSSAREIFESSGMGSVSVRSSATVEDGEDYSAAGQFSTVLNVSGSAALIKACKECMKSLHNSTVEKYARNFLSNSDTCRMNIVVQKMINAKCAGVIFSRAPMRPGFSLVEAVPGLGENLVSGKMSAQQFRVREGLVEKMPDNPVLTREQALELGEAGRKAEKLFGMPMDLEWAIDGDDVIHWLQARPITICESVTINELDCPLESGNCVYTTGNIGEMMPGAVTPLCLSTNMYALDWGVRQTYIEIGCTDDKVPPYSYIAPFYNHMFFNMTNMYAIAHSIFGTTKETMDVSICGQVLQGFPDSDIPDKNAGTKLKNTIPFLKIVMNGKPAISGMDGVVDNLHFDLTLGVRDLYRQIIDNFDYLKKAQYYHYLASYYSGGQTSMLSRIVNEDISGCLTQIEDFESANILRMMHALANLIITDNPDATGYSAAELQEYIDLRADRKVKESYRDFMERHGHRGIREPEIMSLPWRDNPESFFACLKSVISSHVSQTEAEERPWTEYADEILSHYSGIKRKFISSLIGKARKGVCFREYTKSKMILVLDRFKQAYRRLASLMVQEGLLPDEQCIYFLLQDEIGQLIEGDNSLLKKALARRRNFPQLQDLKFPYCQIGVPQPISADKTSPDATVFNGTPVSRGKATGKARIVRNERDASKLKSGEIMVATHTDIGWSPYYSIIAGLITEIGSALSHGVVVAREYALPTVVNVADAMDIIKNGDTVTIDGNTGTIIIDRKA